jgi:hypothetical protein
MKQQVGHTTADILLTYSNEEEENAEDVVATSNEANEEKSSLFYSDLDR